MSYTLNNWTMIYAIDLCKQYEHNIRPHQLDCVLSVVGYRRKVRGGRKIQNPNCKLETKLCVSLSEMPQNMQSGASNCVHFFIFFNSDCWCQVCSTRSRNSEWSLSCSNRKSVVASCSVTASCATMFSAGTTSRSALHTSTEKNSGAMTCKSKIVLARTSHGTTANH